VHDDLRPAADAGKARLHDVEDEEHRGGGVERVAALLQDALARCCRERMVARHRAELLVLHDVLGLERVLAPVLDMGSNLNALEQGQPRKPNGRDAAGRGDVRLVAHVDRAVAPRPDLDLELLEVVGQLRRVARDFDAQNRVVRLEERVDRKPVVGVRRRIECS
jgi:hypothetical protein